MRFWLRVLLLVGLALLGATAGVAAIAVHRSWPGILLAVGTALAILWALRLWLAGGGLAFAAGWAVPVLLGVAGRPEGDYVFSSDAYGWALVASGGVVLVAALAWGRPSRTLTGSGSLGAST